MGRAGKHRAARAALALTLALGGGVAVLGAPPAGAVIVEPTGSVTVTLLGNGHGHGMSQYGAKGAALAGLSAKKIVAFYYPGTTLGPGPGRRIRVQLSGSRPQLTVWPAKDLTVTGVDDPLPVTGVAQYRLAQGRGAGLVLQQLSSKPGATWTKVRAGLPNGAVFRRTGAAPVRVAMANGTSRDYYGLLAAWRTTARGAAGGVLTVDRVSLNHYTAGVVPMEVPTSWPHAAVNAQAIAARTYGAYAMDHPAARRYDICDTSWCQVYGGAAQYDAAGRMTWHDYPRAATATAGKVLTYRGAAIFAQFGASNGGWSVAGGQPYLIAQADPYDNEASGDPYLFYKRRYPVASLAGYFGLAEVTAVVVSKRDGNGTWNGRVLAGYVEGMDAHGKPAKIAVSGSDFANVFGVGTTWFNLRATG
jgi:peptidoglycan hydrolase-like amidase